MSFRKQLQWGGLLIIVVAMLVSITNALFYLRIHNTALHALYGMGFTGLILTCAILHVAQAPRAGLFERVTYLLSVFCLAYVNVATFLDLVEMADIQGTEQAIASVRGPVLLVAIYGLYFVLVLFFVATAQAGVLPPWGGILTALGIALQLPAQFAVNLAGPMFYIFSAGGSVMFGVGLIWIGRSLWSGKGISEGEAHRSTADQAWEAPLVILTALAFAANAYVNAFGELTLANGMLHLISLTALLFGILVLFTAQADRAGGTGFLGFVLTHLGTALSIIPAYLNLAQLAGQIQSNRALLASWQDFPFGRAGSYMLSLGLILFGISVIRADVFPGGSGWLVVMGAVLLSPSQLQSQSNLFLIFRVIGTTLLSIGLAWMGWTVLKKRATVEFRKRYV
jgi:hypothetical protein